MVIKQGDLFWVELSPPYGSEPGYTHPYVIIQNDVFNESRINTVICIALTSNISRAGIPGFVLLNKGEANLTKPSVVNISQITTVDKTDLKGKIGHLTDARIREILIGLYTITDIRKT